MAHPRWLVLKQRGSATGREGVEYWAADQTRRTLHGPWFVPDEVEFVGQAADGRRTLDIRGDDTHSLVSLDPSTGMTTTLVAARPWHDPRYSDDGSAVAVAADADAPVELIDTATGRVRRTFPAAGTGGHALSADGRLIALGTPRRDADTPAADGIDVFDIDSGARVRRVTAFGPPPTQTQLEPGWTAYTPWAAGRPVFARDGRHLTFTVTRSLRSPPPAATMWTVDVPPDGRRAIDLATGDLVLIDSLPDDVTLRADLLNHELGGPSLPHHPTPVSRDRAGDRVLWLGADGQSVRLTDIAGRNPTAWFPVLPPGVLNPDWAVFSGRSFDSAALAHGEAGAVVKLQPGPPPPGLVRSALASVVPALAAPADRVNVYEFHWLDLATGRLSLIRPVRPDAAGGPEVDYAVQPGVVTLLSRDKETGTTTLEFWSTPPPTNPLPWAVPIGLGVGLAATYFAGRRRDKTATPAVPGATAGVGVSPSEERRVGVP